MNRFASLLAIYICHLFLFTMPAHSGLMGQGTITVQLESVATLDTTQAGAALHGTYSHAGDSRLFLVGRKGEIKIVENGALLPTPFLNVKTVFGSNFINFDADRGLLGAVFHPDFNTVGAAGYGKFYTLTSETVSGTPTFSHPEVSNGATTDHDNVLREWTVSQPDSNVVDYSAGSRVVMKIAYPSVWHNGGSLVFGPDKYLYLTNGDGGDPYDTSNAGYNGIYDSPTDGHTNAPNPNPLNLPHGNAQDRGSALGKVLRIKPTTDVQPGIETLSANGQYGIPNSNPFTATSGADPSSIYLDEVYAFGLRNTRISFDRGGDHTLIGADVGQGRTEEVNIIVSGGNYGWVIKEGSQPTPSIPSYTAETTLIDPIAEYNHGDLYPDALTAVIGGFVYRGSAIPELQGMYVFGELGGFPPFSFGPSHLFYLDLADPSKIYDLVISPFGIDKPDVGIHGFAEDAAGELYALFGNGQVVKLVAPPTPGDFDLDGDVDGADFIVWQTNYPTGENATLGTGDADGDGDVDGADFAVWHDRFIGPSEGSAPVPEPAASILVLIGLAAFGWPVIHHLRYRG
jgi:hypothetical protein